MEIQSINELIRFADEKMQKIPIFDSDKYFFDVYCLKPGQDQRVHSHAESDKIYYVLRGKGRFHIAGDEQELDFRSGRHGQAQPVSRRTKRIRRRSGSACFHESAALMLTHSVGGSNGAKRAVDPAMGDS